MPKHHEQRRLPYAPDQVFELVADVERYPEFLPWCEKLEVISRQKQGARETLIAEMVVGFGLYRERFKTAVTLDRPARAISIQYLKGPFKRLENEWRFIGEGQETLVDFNIAFEFRSYPLQLLVGMFFGEAFRRLVAAFDARAAKLYARAPALM